MPTSLKLNSRFVTQDFDKNISSPSPIIPVIFLIFWKFPLEPLHNITQLLQLQLPL